jgi:hypothetical protein
MLHYKKLLALWLTPNYKTRIWYCLLLTYGGLCERLYFCVLAERERLRASISEDLIQLLIWFPL